MPFTLLCRRRAKKLLTWALAPCAGAALGLFTVGCRNGPTASSRSTVSTDIECRMGYSLGPQANPCVTFLPYGIRLEDGLSEDGAILIALWNNAAFNELLADLGIARGDLIQAGLLPNPEFLYYFSAPDKPLRWLVDFPLEALWLRPIRVKAAGSESARVGQRLSQAGLDLIRDVRQAYADAVLARGRQRVAQENLRLRGDIAAMADKRLKAGDASVQEASTARIDANIISQDAARIGFDVPQADERLRNLLGIPRDRTPLSLDEAPPPRRADLDADALVDQGSKSRPDILAADEAVAAASERLRLQKLGWIRFLGIADATTGRKTGHEFGPAFRVTVPIFNQNQGNIARAAAELEKAERARQTTRNLVALDIRQAHYRYAQARAELEILEEKTQPEVEQAIRRAEAAYREGNTPYLVVLETSRQLLDSRLRREQLLAELRRSWADLERGVGRRLEATAIAPPLRVRLP